MRLQHLAMLVLCLSSCADTRRTTVDSGRDSGSLRPRGIELSGNVFAGSGNLGPTVPGLPLEGAEVCRDGVRDCVTTDGHGWFALGGIIPETETLLVISKDGFWPSLQPVVAPSWSTAVALFTLYSRDESRAFNDKFNAALRAGGRPKLDGSDEALESHASILFGAGAGSAYGGLTDQLRVGIEPDSGGVLLFLLQTGEWVLEVAPGKVALAGIYANVEPRDDGYELVYQPADGGECRQTSNAVGGWPSASGSPNATRVPARAGHLTLLSAEQCKPVDAGTASDAGQD